MTKLPEDRVRAFVEGWKQWQGEKWNVPDDISEVYDCTLTVTDLHDVLNELEAWRNHAKQLEKESQKNY